MRCPVVLSLVISFAQADEPSGRKTLPKGVRLTLLEGVKIFGGGDGAGG